MPLFDDFLRQSLMRGQATLQIQWHTPDEYLNAARELMGGIDVDPATDEKAQLRIKAKVYYTKETNGLDKEWRGRLWLGTPYQDGVLEAFCEKAIEEYRKGNLSEGLILTHTNTTHHEYFQHTLETASAICLVRDYIRWLKGHAEEEEAMRKIGVVWNPEYTKHGNIVFYFAPKDINYLYKVEEFKRIFSQFGVCYGR